MYLDINSGGEPFKEPLPFQRFTGKYHDIPYSNITSITTPQACSALCDGDNMCEFWKFRSNRCELFASTGPEISGIKVNKNMRNFQLGSTMVYSSNIPNATQIISSQINNLNDCESACNSTAQCGAYSFNPIRGACTLYGSGTPATGNVGASRSFSLTVKNLDNTVTSSNGLAYYNSNIFVSDGNRIKLFNVYSSSFTTTFAQTIQTPNFITTTDGMNIYISNTAGNVIQRFNPSTNQITLIAGSATLPAARTSGSLTNGISSARLKSPMGITQIGVGGTIYVADTGNNGIVSITPAGALNLLAGSGTGLAGFVNATGTSALFNKPTGITSIVNTIFIADTGNNCIRACSTGGAVSTIAGTNSSGYADGIGTVSRFESPKCIVAVGTVLYVSDGIGTNSRIRSINLSDRNVVTTIAGNVPTPSITYEGTESNVSFNEITSMTVDPVNNILYVCDSVGLKSISLNVPSSVAYGGDFVEETVIGGIRYRVHTYTSPNGIFVTPSNKILLIDFLLVGGGGGGGNTSTTGVGTGGGGGAGGQVLSFSGISISPSSRLSVTVGVGGNSGMRGTASRITNASGVIVGGTSAQAIGGGEGYTPGVAISSIISVGYNAGGGAYTTTSTNILPPNVTSGFYRGGAANVSTLPRSSGGGAGANGNGGSGTSSAAGAGGLGIVNNITGAPVTYGAGAPGVINNTSSRQTSSNAPGYGGGGGAGQNGAAGLKGNDGVVIIRYRI